MRSKQLSIGSNPIRCNKNNYKNFNFINEDWQIIKILQLNEVHKIKKQKNKSNDVY